MPRYRFVFAPLLALVLPGCSASSDEDSKMPAELRIALEKGTEFELFSLRPANPDNPIPPDSFHDETILGKTMVKDAEARNRLVTALKKAVYESQGAPGCFNPRHGIRVTYKGRTVDLVICFECWQVMAYVGDERVKGFMVHESPQAVFDEILKEANVPLAEKPKLR